jgi:hypothetical protein
MNQEYLPFWVFVVFLVFQMLMSIRRATDAKLNIINKKLDAVLTSTSAPYPLIGDISKNALKAAKGGDRNKAVTIIIKETLCTKVQAQAIIEIIEQQVISDLNANHSDK